MRPSAGRSLSKSDTLLLVACLVLSLALLIMPSAWSNAFASGVRSTALAPAVWLQANAEEQRTSRLRLRSIAAARDSLALLLQGVSELETENDQLRQLLALRPRAPFRTVAAEILHQASATDGRTLLLGTGEKEGVRAGTPVVTPEGLLGLVISTEAASSVAMTWAHPDFAVSAVTEHGGVLGIVAPPTGPGASESFLELRGVPYRDSVAVGTLVVTSGLTGVYPQGIPIGTVAGIRREEAGWERVYRLTPLANPGRASHALIYLVPPERSRPVPGTD
ncbi:MAG: rod shape-determining protein MreC [Gemmatimonadales bacterium]